MQTHAHRLSFYGSTVIVQWMICGSWSLPVAEPSPPAPVVKSSALLSQSTVDAVPPMTCESTDTDTFVSGVLWNVTSASALSGLSAQPDDVTTVTVLSASPW